jgi:branched-chain amino acid transport system substrate-binding protein
MLLAGTAGCQSRDPVRLGIAVSDQSVVAAQLAADEINATGGIRGRTLALELKPGSSTRANLALAAADELSGNPDVVAVVGHSNSSASLSAAQVYNSRRIVQIAPTSSAPLFSQTGAFTFRLVASDIHQAEFLAAEIESGGARPRTAVFFVNDDYGHALHEEVRKLLVRAHVPLVQKILFNEEDDLQDVAGIVGALADSRPELLLWLGRSRQLRQILPELRGVLPQLPILASDSVNDEIAEANLDGALTGVRYVCFVDPSESRPSLKALRARFRARRGTALTVESALTYDAVMLLAKAARDVGPDREAIREYLAALGTRRPAFEGVTGTFSFDDNGDPAPSYFLAEFTADGSRLYSAVPPK